MAIKLIITEKSDPSSKYERSFIQDRVVIGRSRTADVCLPAMAVSTRHAEIRLAGANYTIVDLESLNGTIVNQESTLAYRNKKLKDGDIIEIANFQIQFQMGVPTPSEESRDKAVQQARDMLTGILARSGQGQVSHNLYILVGQSKGMRVELVPHVKRWILGRGKNVDIFIDDPDVSREHAAVVVEAAGIFVKDLNSQNGVFVNGQRVEATKLKEGSQFTIGGTTIMLEHPTEKSLGMIFEAPEEDTASFMLTGERMSSSEVRRASTPEPLSPPAPDTDDAQETTNPVAPAVGPADPLLAPTNDDTDEHPNLIENKTSQPNTDIGLIIIGSLILIAAVTGLIYLFQ